MFAHGTDHADELPYLRQLAFALAVEQISRARERRAVGKEERFRDAVEIVQADLRHDAPAEARLHHGDAGGHRHSPGCG